MRKDLLKDMIDKCDDVSGLCGSVHISLSSVSSSFDASVTFLLILGVLLLMTLPVIDRSGLFIYAFTLITIIFLPMSAFSSIFGMNTTDVRDMPYSQWLYWAVAIPVTIVVILIGL
jgi:Mg2+ and Co2+ transporter CorA